MAIPIKIIGTGLGHARARAGCPWHKIFGATKGLLRSHAGMNGGYALSRDARQISAFEVIHAIDGPLFITSCFKGAKSCDLTPSCTIKEPLARVNETIAGVLKSISIQDLAEQEHPAAKAPDAQGLVSLTL